MTQVPDIINGMFELGGGLTGVMNCVRLYKDKQIHGVIWQLNLFYTLWGLWNLYYYPSLSQWWSFVGGIVIVAANFIWTAQAIYYTYFITE